MILIGNRILDYRNANYAEQTANDFINIQQTSTGNELVYNSGTSNKFVFLGIDTNGKPSNKVQDMFYKCSFNSSIAKV